MLSDHASNVYSYAGEDGMIQRLLDLLRIESGTCVEFGAWDGIECSNTAALRDQGWRTILIEGDDDRFESLQNLRSETVECIKAFVRPEGAESIDSLLGGQQVDLMSIDIDGDDYFIFESMQTRPTVVVIEYNQTVPWFMDVRAASPGNRFGASALSLNRLATEKGYSLVGATETNLIFVENFKGREVDEYAVDYDQIMLELPMRFGVTITNYTCDQYETNFGNLPKWGWRSNKPVDELIYGPLLYSGSSRAISERFRDERV